MCVIYSFTSPFNVWHWAFNEMSAYGTFIRKYGVYLRHKGSPLTRCYDTHLLLTRTKEAARCRLHAKQNKASEQGYTNLQQMTLQSGKRATAAPQNFVQFFAIKMILFT